MKRHVYLAGPILGCTGPEANKWRSVEERQSDAEMIARALNLMNGGLPVEE